MPPTPELAAFETDTEQALAESADLIAEDERGETDAQPVLVEPASGEAAVAPSRNRFNTLKVVASIAVLSIATVGGIKYLLKESERQAAERRAADQQRRAQEREASRIEFVRGGMEWRLIRARRAVEAWQAHKDQRKIMERKDLALCLATIQVWMDEVEQIRAYETKGGRASDITMYHLLEIPTIKPSADELRAALQDAAGQ